MPHPFPHRYNSSLRRAASGEAVLDAPPRAAIAGSSPPEFDGHDRSWSPEHLLLSSVQLCLMLTFESLIKKARIGVESYASRAECAVDKTPEGLRITAVDVQVDVRLAADADAHKAEELMHTAEKYCIISNAVKAPITLGVRIGAQ